MDIDQQKATLRTAQRAVRKTAAGALGPAPHDVSLLKALIEPSDCVAGYAAIHSEPDVFDLMETLQVPLALPVVPGPDQPLLFRSFAVGDALNAGAFGARIPADSAAIVTPTVLLVPLLAFDERRYRLGYGGGFYDRTIAAIKPRLTIGIAYAAQRVACVPIGEFDVPLDFILTEEGMQ